MRKRVLFILFIVLSLALQGQVMKTPGRFPFYVPTLASGFPQILAGTSQGHDVDNVTTRAITMPTGTTVGDLILVFITCDGVDGTDLVINTVVSGSNWTMENKTAYADGNMTSAIIWKIAEGSDTLTITSTAERAAYIAYRLSGANTSDPITVTNTTGAKTTNYDPPANTGLGGAINYTWFVYASSQNNPQVVASSAPTDFDNLLTETAEAVSQPSVSVARREYNYGDAYNPGTFTAGAAWYLAFTVIVNPL